MRIKTKALALVIRRFPFEAGRWRLVSAGLEQCKHDVVTSTFRTVRTRSGFRMCIDVSDWFGRHIYVTGEYEPATARLIGSCLNENGVFIDVGANAGYFALLAALKVGPAGRVLAFEPNPRVRERLQRNVDLNGFSQCTIFDAAASNHEGTCDLFVGPSDHQGLSSLRRLRNFSETVPVKLSRLDVLVPKDLRIDVVKIDVEGAESHVLEGMEEIIQRSRPKIVCEITAKYLAAMGRSPEHIENLVRNFGYGSFAIEHEGLRPLNRLQNYGDRQFNAFFCAKEDLPRQFPVLPAPT